MHSRCRRTVIVAVLASVFLVPAAAQTATFEPANTDELIEAMAQAGTTTGPHVIKLAAQHTYTLDSEYAGGLALAPVTEELRIEGNGATLEWNGETETGFFHVAEEGRLEGLRLTLTGARASAIVVDGGLDLRRSRLIGNHIGSDQTRANALTVSESGQATVRGSVFQENIFRSIANHNAPGEVPLCSSDRPVGGAMFNAGSLRVVGSTFIGNQASCHTQFNFISVAHYDIGALFNTGTATMVNVTFHDHAGASRVNQGRKSVVNQGSMKFINVTVLEDELLNEESGTFSTVNSAFVGASCTALDSQGGNISTATGCSLDHPTDRRVNTLRTAGTDGKLDGTGLVPVLLPQPGSHLLDAADPAQCPERDALGRERPADGNHDGRARCDVGAVELHPGAYPVDGRVIGLWFEPERDGHYLIVEQPGPGRLILIWATYDGAGDPLWLFGSGELEGNSLTVDLSLQTGMRFGAFRGSDLNTEAWGQMSLEITNCREMAMNWQAHGRPELNGEAVLSRLTQVQGQECLP